MGGLLERTTSTLSALTTAFATGLGHGTAQVIYSFSSAAIFGCGMELLKIEVGAPVVP